jgi:SNF2 family DNA or RNA helicase
MWDKFCLYIDDRSLEDEIRVLKAQNHSLQIDSTCSVQTKNKINNKTEKVTNKSRKKRNNEKEGKKNRNSHNSTSNISISTTITPNVQRADQDTILLDTHSAMQSHILSPENIIDDVDLGIGLEDEPVFTEPGIQIDEYDENLIAALSQEEEPIIQELDIEQENKIDANLLQEINELEETPVIIEGEENTLLNEISTLVVVPPYMYTKLLPHQKVGLKFLWDHIINNRGCILADYMGLGKTLQVVCFLRLYMNMNPKHAVLVLVPNSVIKHWDREFDKVNKWAGGTPYNPLTLTTKTVITSRLAVIQKWHEDGGVLLTSYDLYRNLVFSGEAIHQELLSDPGPNMIILDEGHKIKNVSARIHKALNKVATQKRIILTGYPLQNNLIEYWTMLSFVRPNFLGPLSTYKQLYVKPIVRGQTSDDPTPRMIARRRAWILHRKVSEMVLRRDISLLKPHLPEKKEFVIHIRVGEVQLNLYKAILKGLEDDLGQYRPNLFWVYDVLILLCNHPDVLSSYYHNRMKAIQDILKKEIKSPTDTISNTASITDSHIDAISDADMNEPELVNICPIPEEERKPPSQEVSESDLAAITMIGKLLDAASSYYRKGVVDNGGKMVILYSIIFQCKLIGDRLVVFSRSLNTLDFIEATLKRYNKNKTSDGQVHYSRFDGNTKLEERQEIIDDFNNDQGVSRLLLVSTLVCKLLV